MLYRNGTICWCIVESLLYRQFPQYCIPSLLDESEFADNLTLKPARVKRAETFSGDDVPSGGGPTDLALRSNRTLLEALP